MAQHQEESCVPPGFRFHPTEEELVGYYLARKVASQKIDLDIIQEVDLYRIEPWDLQGMQKFISASAQFILWFQHGDRSNLCEFLTNNFALLSPPREMRHRRRQGRR
jgi:hypothetical protein